MEELNKSVQKSQTPADATQRVHINGPARKASSQPKANQAPAGKRTKTKKRTNKVLIIVLCSVVIALLITAIILQFAFPKTKEDDGRIRNNVYAAGVNLSGMTPEMAKKALQAATDYTYNQLAMTITILEREVKLLPEDTGAQLDVDAVVEAAYAYGRTSPSGTSNYISIIPYLNLNTDYIQSVVDELGEQYSSLLTEPSYRLEGDRPSMDVGIENVDTEKVHQTLVVTMGMPEYVLDTNKLYNQIIDAYESNIFSIQADCTVNNPGTLDLDKVYKDIQCIDPINAILNMDTFEVTNEVYGYGFNLAEAKAMLENAKDGEEVRIGLTFIQPDETAEELAGDLFRDTLAKYSLTTNKDPNVIANLKLACKAINGILIKSGEKFSFNTIVGQTSKVKGYKIADSGAYGINDGNYGGGVSLLASGIYYCAILSDMDVSDHANHRYASSYISLGLDADISYGVQDLIFTNTSHRPIKINAKVSSKGVLTVSFEGTANEEYTIKVSVKKAKTLNPSTLVQQMMVGNASGYQDGDVLVSAITGYEVNVYRTYRYVSTSGSEQKLIAYATYEKRNALVVELVEPEPEPTLPPETEPPVSEPLDPSEPPVSEPPVPESTTPPESGNGSDIPA